MSSYIVVDTFRAAAVSSHRTIAAAVNGMRKYGRVCPTMPTAVRAVRAVRAVDARAKSDSMLDASRDLTEAEVDVMVACP